MNEGTVSRSTYSFQYGNTYFIALDVDVVYYAGSDQYRWLEDQLEYAKSQPSIKHCIVHAHFPPFSCSNHGEDKDVIAFRRAMVPLFQEYDIDLYMSGHDHTYQRSVVNGLTYLVTGCASGRLYDCDPRDWTVVCEKTANYSYIEIDGTQISVEARRPDNSVIDSFIIDHDFHNSDDDTGDDDDDNDDNDDNDTADDDFAPPTDDDAADDDNDDDSGGCGC
jgi:hypothetical protein